ncbi:hypothetical protein FHEFKHOI_00153 [Candidatus Methanoperedenaceae archaeon GB50]|nr:hypothetical protein FHEFKHOI_00153 [Candidatus Methanoperedenaceae archaeon GB50]CAD7779632.1 MAG: hypothetical protein KBONHNOK_01348 [Candidatus Methanoperedenaceae archaeon GB50]
MSTVTLKEKLENILNGLRASNRIEMAAIISRDGLIIATDSSQDHRKVKIRTFAALTATLNLSAETTIKRLSEKAPQSIIVETPERYLIIRRASSDTFVVTLTTAKEELNEVLQEVKEAAEEVKELI